MCCCVQAGLIPRMLAYLFERIHELESVQVRGLDPALSALGCNLHPLSLGHPWVSRGRPA